MAGSVIQATGTVELKDGLNRDVLLGGCWCPFGGCTNPRINLKLPSGCDPALGLVIVRTPFQTKFQITGSAYQSIKLQMLCIVRIEPAYKVRILFVT